MLTWCTPGRVVLCSVRGLPRRVYLKVLLYVLALSTLCLSGLSLVRPLVFSVCSPSVYLLVYLYACFSTPLSMYLCIPPVRFSLFFSVFLVVSPSVYLSGLFLCSSTSQPFCTAIYLFPSLHRLSCFVFFLWFSVLSIHSLYCLSVFAFVRHCHPLSVFSPLI